MLCKREKKGKERGPFITNLLWKVEPIIRMTQSVHILWKAYNFGTSVFWGLFLSFPILILSSSFSLSLTPPSLSTSFPPFLSFHLRLFNLFNDHLPSSFHPLIITDILTHYAFCVQNALCHLILFLSYIFSWILIFYKNTRKKIMFYTLYVEFWKMNLFFFAWKWYWFILLLWD